MQEYHKQCVRRLDTTAIYEGQDTTPVAWQIQWAFDGTIGNGFTLPAYRGKGLATMMLAESCKSILARSQMPEICVSDGNPSIAMYQKIGVSHIGRVNGIHLHINNDNIP